MMQPDFALTPPEPKPPHKRTRGVCVAGYEILDVTGAIETRRERVKRWLSHYWQRHQQSPTSGELTAFARWRHHDEMDMRCFNCTALFVRRGLSDLQRVRVAETVPQGERTCRRQGTLQETWRIVERGT